MSFINFSLIGINKSKIVYFKSVLHPKDSTKYRIEMMIECASASNIYEEFNTAEECKRRINNLAIELGGSPIYPKEVSKTE